ncbi:unnamed protein product [Linum trigynum]|uniref:Uncharacterized protein n=1 Tax=Linum trigynum TaxID=586398 RepID=A0AAV2DZL2_9ROSI
MPTRLRSSVVEEKRDEIEKLLTENEERWRRWSGAEEGRRSVDVDHPDLAAEEVFFGARRRPRSHLQPRSQGRQLQQFPPTMPLSQSSAIYSVLSDFSIGSIYPVAKIVVDFARITKRRRWPTGLTTVPPLLSSSCSI